MNMRKVNVSDARNMRRVEVEEHAQMGWSKGLKLHRDPPHTTQNMREVG